MSFNNFNFNTLTNLHHFFSSSHFQFKVFGWFNCSYFYFLCGNIFIYLFLFDPTFSGTWLGRELRAYFSYSSYLHCSGHCENSVIIETYIAIGYNLTDVLSILLILRLEVNHILNIVMRLLLVRFALYNTVRHKACVRKCCQRVHSTLFKAEQANFHN